MMCPIFDALDDFPKVYEVMLEYRTQFEAVLDNLQADQVAGILNAIEDRYCMYRISETDKDDWVFYMKKRLRLNKDYFKRVLDKYFEELDETQGYAYNKTSTTGTTSSGSGSSNAAINEENSIDTTSSNSGAGHSTNSKFTTHIELPTRQTQNEYPNDKLNETGDSDYSETNSANENKDYSSDITDDRTYAQSNESQESFSEQRSGGVNVVDQRERMLKYIKNIYYDFTELFKDLVLQLYY